MSWSDWFLPSQSMTAEEQSANAARTQKLLADRMAAREAAGTMDAAHQAEYQDAINTQLDNQNQETLVAAEEGAVEGFNNVLQAPGKVVGFVGDSVGSMGWGILKNVPWWAYGIAILALGLYLLPMLLPLFAVKKAIK